MDRAGTNGEAGGSTLEPWDLIRQVLERGRVDGLDDVQLATGIYVVLQSHGHVPDPSPTRMVVRDLYNHARRRIGEGGDRIEFKACRSQATGGLTLSAVESGGQGVYVCVGTAPEPGAFLARIAEEERVPEGLEALVRLAVEKIRRQQVPA